MRKDLLRNIGTEIKRSESQMRFFAFGSLLFTSSYSILFKPVLIGLNEAISVITAIIAAIGIHEA